jgi:hypothetical protein
LAPQDERPAGWVTERIEETAAGDADGQASAAIAKFAYQQTPWDAQADLPGREPEHRAFASTADEPFAAPQPVAPADLALTVPLQQLDDYGLTAEAEPEPAATAAESHDAEEVLAAQNDAAGNELVAGLATMVAHQARLRRGRWRVPVLRLLLVLLGLLIADAAIIGRRADLARSMPQTASFYARLGLPVNLRGVDFDGVSAVTEEHGNNSVLVVSGDVMNGTGDTQDVPQLRFALCNAAHEEIYSWTVAPMRTTFAGGRSTDVPQPTSSAAARYSGGSG